METFDEKLKRVLSEEVSLSAYDSFWPECFAKERDWLRNQFPSLLSGRIEHFGSTAVPGLCAKPIIDMLIEVKELQSARQIIAPALESQGYDYFWRSSWDDGKPPFYAWFIKRNAEGKRSHHIHVVEPDFEHWERLLFRDFLIANPTLAADYAKLKTKLASEFPNDRVAYTIAKTDFIRRVTDLALKIHEKRSGQ